MNSTYTRDCRHLLQVASYMDIHKSGSGEGLRSPSASCFSYSLVSWGDAVPWHADNDDPSRVDDSRRAASTDGRALTGDYVVGDRKKKSRTVFSRRQVLELETTFAASRYLSSVDRCWLAARLQLSETQVKIWFQNRRNKCKRQQAADTSGVGALQPGLVTPHSSAWNGGCAMTTPAETGAVAVVSGLADEYGRLSPVGDTAHRHRLLSRSVTMSTSCGYPPLVCPVVSLHHYTNSRLSSIL